MAIHNVSRGGYGRPSPHASQHTRLPAPIKGIDTRVGLASNDPLICIYAYNLVPSEYALRLRDGYREWAVDLVDGTSSGVKTIIPFKSSAGGNVNDRLWAVTNEGIWDVTTFDTPVLKLSFANSDPEAGNGVYSHYVDNADNEFLYYADSLNGLFEYTQDTDTWALADDITGVDPLLINFVVVHKLRIWFCLRNSTTAYYFPITSGSGAAIAFNFGGKFKHGGTLIGLYNWSVDGGNGINDYLVAISSSGDVLPYTGSDPTADDWSIVGTYFIGVMAKGNKCASQYGGNTTLLSAFGITQMSDLLQGVDPRGNEDDSIGARISPAIRRDMQLYRDFDGWDIKFLQKNGILIVTTPVRDDGTYIQYVYNHSIRAWGLWRGLPILSIDSWNDEIYFGSIDSKVYSMDADKDNILIIPEDEINGLPIEFSMLHNYSDLDDPSTYKRGKLIRPDFLAPVNPSYIAKFFYNYEVGEIGVIPFSDTFNIALWDDAVWDKDVWATTDLLNFDRIIGGSGMGRYVSVAVKGEGLAGTSLISVDITWDTGWFL